MTESREAELRMRRSEARWGLLIGAVAGAAVTIQDRDSVLVTLAFVVGGAVVTALFVYFGIGFLEAVGRSVRNRIDGPDKRR